MKKRNRVVASMLTAAMAVSMVFSSSALSVLASDSSFAEMIETKYRAPEMQHRPYARWWLAEGSHTDETLKESIKELYDAGYGGIEFVTLTSEAEYLDDETYGWGSPEWIHDSKLIISECAKYGMSVSMTGGTYWATANLPNITPDMQEASQELGYKTQELLGTEGTNTSYSGALPLCDLPEDSTQRSLVSVVAAKVESWGTVSEESEESTEGAETAEETEAAEEAAKTVINTDSLTVVPDENITDNGDGTWNVDFTAEDDGDYILFAFYQYGTSESYAASHTGKNYTINYFDPVGANALISYWDENVLTEDVQEIIDQIDECSLYMDSLELATMGPDSTKQLWCTDMLEEFSSRRGYDLEKYLPLMIRETPDGIEGMGTNLTYVFDNTETDEIDVTDLRNDFFQTETELYQENCLDVLADWLHSKNMKLRAEPSYGKTFEVTQTVSSLDYLETESFEFAGEIDSYRNFSGAAHIFDKRLSSETGASIATNYLWNSGYYRQIMYAQYASGIQKTVTHGYSSEYGPEESVAWPGYEGMTTVIAERFNKRQPSYVDSVDVNTHLSRIQKVLEQGEPQVDIAMLRTDYYLNNLLTSVSSSGVYNNRLHQNEAYYWQDMELQNAGYTYEYFSPYLLTDEAVDMSDGMINSDGVAYKAVIVMQDELPLESAYALLEGAQNGLPIVFVNNVVEDVNNDHVMKVNTTAGSTTGSNDGNDEELAEVVAQIKECENVRTIDSTEDAYETLMELGVTPRVEYEEPNAKILTNMRKDEDATYLYVYNYMYEDTEDFVGNISIEGTYQPYELDTWSGSVTEVSNAVSADGRTTISVELAPGDVAVYVLDPSGEAAGELIETAAVTETTTETAATETAATEATTETAATEAATETTATEATTETAVTETAATETTTETTATEATTETAVTEATTETAETEAATEAAVENIVSDDGSLALNGWSLTVDSYTPGNKVERTETNEETGVTTTEVTYSTNHELLDAGVLDEMVPWKDIEALGEYVSGVGTYTTTFTLPEDWDSTDKKVMFEADSFNLGTAMIMVNDQKAVVNMDACEADLTDLVKAGENTISVRVTSSLCNVARSYDGISWITEETPAADYGMTGNAVITISNIE